MTRPSLHCCRKAARRPLRRRPSFRRCSLPRAEHICSPAGISSKSKAWSRCMRSSEQSRSEHLLAVRMCWTRFSELISLGDTFNSLGMGTTRRGTQDDGRKRTAIGHKPLQLNQRRPFAKRRLVSSAARRSPILVGTGTGGRRRKSCTSRRGLNGAQSAPLRYSDLCLRVPVNTLD
jgi:hypothetical protein